MIEINIVTKKSLIFCLLIHCLQIKRICSIQKTTPRPVTEWHFIDNWDKYKLPKPVHVRDLAAILAKVSGYKNMKYCPFEKPEDCQRLSMEDAIKKIVEMNIKYSQDFYTVKPTSNCHGDSAKSQRIVRPFASLPSFGGRSGLYMTKESRG